MGDYDGDRKADLCVFFAPASKWYLARSSDNASVTLTGFGSPEMDPVSGDFDGDGRDDFAAYHPPTGTWRILQSRSGLVAQYNWGWDQTEPVPGDYDGDGKTDLAVFHRAAGNWYIRNSSTGSSRAQNWGWSAVEPVQADYDGDGKTDLAVYNPATGDWFILQSSNGQSLRFNPGWKNCQPVPGYYDADNRADPAVFHIASGTWYWINTSKLSYGSRQWGWSASEPAAANYRVQDDAAYYGHSFVHDYDVDSFSSTGKFPRTGTATSTTPAPTPAPAPVVTNTPAPSTPTVPANVAGVTWLHADVSTWRQTATLSSVNLSGSSITLNYNKANAWPGVNHVGANVNANPWIFVQKPGGGWYAATWEWMKVGQTTKNKSSVAGDHIKKSPLENFRPVPGEWYGFMVSGLARDSTRNVYERSNVVMLKWQ